MINDNYENFDEEIKKMNSKEIVLLNTAYLEFSAKFIEYVKEMDTELCKRATDYAVTVNVKNSPKK